jgi:hypothetical protein
MANNIIKLLRSIIAGSRPSGHVYGEPYVNLSDNQFGVFDSSNVARDLLGVPFFSPAANYAANNPVNYQGQLYSAKAAVPAGAWNPAQWNAIGGGVPTGAVMLFYMAAAPTGWTQVTTQNDKALRVVSGAGGVTGGSSSFSSVMAQTVVGSTTITTSIMPAHFHTFGNGAYSTFGIGNFGTGGQSVPQTGTDFSIFAYIANTDNNGGSGSHNHTINMNLAYIDIIIASKN